METYNGHVRTPNDAIILFEACRLGLLPRVQRRLSEKERQSIRSGSVFVWDEREAGMRRWTDGKSWSASRVSGSFLTYREMEGKRGGSGFSAPVSSRGGKTPESNMNSGDDRDQENEEGPDGYRFKPDGLMKQSFSITTQSGQHLHLINYYTRSHLPSPGLQTPSTDPSLRSIRPQKGMYPESTISDQSAVPVVTRAPMVGAPNYGVLPPSPAGYGPPGATHPQSYVPGGYVPPGYPYAQSPISATRNGYALPPQYSPQYTPVHHGIPQFPNAPYPPQPAPYNHIAPHQDARPPGPGYSQRPALSPEENLLSPPPPPPPPPPAGQYSNPPPSDNGPAYAPGPSPSFSHAPPRAEHRSPPQQAATALQIDPRLMAPEPPKPVNGPSSMKPEECPSDVKPHENGTSPTSTASQAPTIGALVYGNFFSDLSDAAKAEEGGERPGSLSPGGTKTSGAPQDIPSEKLGFREDKRALRQLDKVFTA